ncbi:MAG: hypothetical protein JXR70_02360 [Spirochaetales bacterium]|nr:hypothetical protein [Spirochaetales bacterium]
MNKKIALILLIVIAGLFMVSSLHATDLSSTIKKIESDQETIRNARTSASTAFQNFDQKANQLYNLLSTVLKTMKEMRSGTIRNML